MDDRYVCRCGLQEPQSKTKMNLSPPSAVLALRSSRSREVRNWASVFKEALQ